MSQQNHPRRRQQSDASYRPKDSFRQEESGANRNNRTLGDRIHLPLKDRLELPNHQDYSVYRAADTSDRMDFTQRNGRYFTQGEGVRGSLDERIGKFPEHSRGTSGKQYARNRREEPMNYDDKPTQRNFEDRVYVDNRTLEERISGATPTSARKSTHNNGNEGSVNKPGNSNPPKQSKKGQNKVHKQNIRSQESVVSMLTEPQLQEETNGGTIVGRNTGSGKLTTAPTAGTTFDEPQHNQPIMRQEGDMDAQIAKKNLQLEGPSVSTATTNTPSPIPTLTQEQLRERVLASMQKKKAQAEAKEKDTTATVSPSKAKPTVALDVAAIQVRSPNFEEPSALSALERHLNPPVRKTDPEREERDAAVAAMLAEVQASSSGAEERRASLEKAAKGEDSPTTKEGQKIVITMNTAQQTSNAEAIPSINIPKPITIIADKNQRILKEAHACDKKTPKKELEAGKENDTQYLPSENQSGTSVAASGQSDTRQKLTKLPPLQTSTPVSQTSSGKPSYRYDRSGEDDDYWRKERSGPYSAPIRHHPYNSGRRSKDGDDIFEQPGSAVDRRARYWGDRTEIAEREYKRPADELRCRLEKQLSRTNIKEEYSEDIYRNDGNREEEARDQFYASQRLSQLPPSTRALLSTEDYSYPPEYSPYNAIRYLPIRGEEHLTRQPEYDPYYKDLAEWLEITGFHDVDYRQTALRRHRERELDRLYAMRVAAASVTTRGDEIPSPVDRRAVSASNLMPPPQLPGRAERGNPDLSLRAASRIGMYTSRPLPPPQPPSGRLDDRLPPTRFNEGYRIPSPPPESVGLKRRIPQDEQNGGHRPEKSSRTAYETHPRNSSPRPEDEHFECRGGRPDPTDGGPSRRVPDVKEQDEAPSPQFFRRTGRPSTPVREIQEKLAARSPSPSRFHENEQRRAAFKEGGPYKGRLTEDDQGGKPGKKLYEKIDRRGGSPDSSPRMEKGFYRGRGGYNNSARYQQMGNDHRSQFGHEYDDGFRSPGRGNFGYRRGSFDDSRRKSGYGRGSGDHGRDWYNRGERREKPPASRSNLGSDQMDVDSSSGAISTG
ncbi:hypothetical protein BGX38DRAFT_1143436 [Terfezia claveryi]|nr:hypothetical protein BGX38DRAFT_1143436 [Terfezia claveryi]